MAVSLKPLAPIPARLAFLWPLCGLTAMGLFVQEEEQGAQSNGEVERWGQMREKDGEKSEPDGESQPFWRLLVPKELG